MSIYRCNVPNGDEVAKFGHVQNKAQINAFLYIKPMPRFTHCEFPSAWIQ